MGEALGYGAGPGSTRSKMPIAVIGLSCRFPGEATNPPELWDMLCEGKSAWSPIPSDRLNAAAFYHPITDRNETVLGYDCCYEHIAACIDKLACKNPATRIFEIGAGTGGTTRTILETLAGTNKSYPQFASYDFTDISLGFFEKARANFPATAGLIQCKQLDIEHSPVGQSFEEGAYDLVVATNALHATQKMRTTMAHARHLLRPVDKLVFVEITQHAIRLTLAFDSLPGWWMGAAGGRTEGPSLSEDAWNRVLCDTGFTGVEPAAPDFSDSQDRIYSVLVLTAAPETAARSLPRVFVVQPATTTNIESPTTVYRIVESINAFTAASGSTEPAIFLSLDQLSTASSWPSIWGAPVVRSL